MSGDFMTAAALLGAWFLSAINIWALFKDGDAKGIRPYSNIYFSASNLILAMNLWQLGQVLCATVSMMFVALNATYAALIIRYQWFKRSATIMVIMHSQNGGMIMDMQKDTPPSPPSKEDIRRDIESDPSRRDFYDIPPAPDKDIPTPPWQDRPN